MTKKILALILAALMLISMVACSKDDNTENNDNITIATDPSISESTDETTNNEDPTQPSVEETEPTEQGFVWETKPMSAPVVTEPTTTTVTIQSVNGVAISSTLVNPEFKLVLSDELRNTIKSSPLLKNWVFADSIKERGAPVSYSDIAGVRYTYNYTEAFCAKPAAEAEDASAFYDFDLSRTWNTGIATDFNSIQLHMYIEGEALNNNTQKQVADLLCAVYGDEIGNYLCYAATDGKYTISSVKYDSSSLEFRRTVQYDESLNRCEVSFGLITSSAGEPHDAISCENYTPAADFTNLNKILGSKFAFDPAKYDRYGEEVLKTHFKDYLGVETDSNGVDGYVYNHIKYENGYEEESFTLDGDLRQSGRTKKFMPEFGISVVNRFKDGQLIYTKGDIDMSLGASDESDDAKLHQEFDSHAVVVLEELIAGDQGIKTNLQLNSGGYADTYTTNVPIENQDSDLKFSYRISTESGGEQGIVFVSWITNLT